MGFFNNFPYTNFHEINLDWILNEIGKLKTYVEEYTAVNSVGYAGIWDITKQYPKWSIVSNEDSAYLSVENVPSGVAIGNSKYWKQLADLDPRIGAVLNQIETIEQSVSEIEQSVSEIGKKRFIIIGDSYLEGYSPDGNVVGFGDVFKDFFGFADNDCYLWKNSGGGFSRIGNTGYTFGGLIEAWHNKVDNPSTISHVFMIGGYNDIPTYDQVTNNITLAIDYCKTYFPNARLYVGFVGRNCSTSNNGQASLISVYKAVKSSAASYLTNIEYACRDITMFSSDGFHPNQAGQNAIAKALCDIVATGSYSPCTLITNTGVGGLTTTTINGPDLNLFIPNSAELSIPDIAGTTLNGAVKHDLGLITGGALATCAYGASIPTTGVVKTSTGWENCSVRFTVDSTRHLLVYIMCPTGTTAGWATAASDSTGVTLLGGFVNYPAIFC